MAASISSSNSDSRKMECAGVESGEKILVGLSGLGLACANAEAAPLRKNNVMSLAARRIADPDLVVVPQIGTVAVVNADLCPEPGLSGMQYARECNLAAVGKTRL